MKSTDVIAWIMVCIERLKSCVELVHFVVLLLPHPLHLCAFLSTASPHQLISSPIEGHLFTQVHCFALNLEGWDTD